jgi:hypothetical protein
MKPKLANKSGLYDKVYDKAKSLFHRRNRASIVSAEEQSSLSSATPSRSSFVAPITVNTPLPSTADPESSKSPELSQISAYRSSHVSSTLSPPINAPSPDASSESLAASELQPIRCSQDPPPPVSLIVTSPEVQVYPKAFQSTMTPLSDLWSRAIDEAKDESDTLKWLQKYGLVSTGGTQQVNQNGSQDSQSQMYRKSHIDELISLIDADKLSEQNDRPLKISIGDREVIIRDYIANTVAFITKIGDVAFAFAPAEASAPWAIAKAVLQVSFRSIAILVSSKPNERRRRASIKH